MTIESIATRLKLSARDVDAVCLSLVREGLLSATNGMMFIVDGALDRTFYLEGRRRHRREELGRQDPPTGKQLRMRL